MLFLEIAAGVFVGLCLFQMRWLLVSIAFVLLLLIAAGQMTSPLPQIKRAKAAHIFARADHDFYVEPEWCSERLFAAKPFNGPVHDPACGLGRIVEAATKAGHLASRSDIVERSESERFCV
jgi:hypothetical protein